MLKEWEWGLEFLLKLKSLQDYGNLDFNMYLTINGELMFVPLKMQRKYSKQGQIKRDPFSHRVVLVGLILLKLDILMLFRRFPQQDLHMV